MYKYNYIMMTILYQGGKKQLIYNTTVVPVLKHKFQSQNNVSNYILPFWLKF